MLIEQPEQEELTFKQKVAEILKIPVKVVVASTFIIMNAFQTRAQERQLNKIMKSVKEDYNTNPETIKELQKYLFEVDSINHFDCPVLVRQYVPNHDPGAYSIGLIISQEILWTQAIKKIKEHIKIDQHTSISFFCGNVIVGQGIVRNFYNKYRHQDGILYIQYMKLESYG